MALGLGTDVQGDWAWVPDGSVFLMLPSRISKSPLSLQWILDLLKIASSDLDEWVSTHTPLVAITIYAILWLFMLSLPDNL